MSEISGYSVALEEIAIGYVKLQELYRNSGDGTYSSSWIAEASAIISGLSKYYPRLNELKVDRNGIAEAVDAISRGGSIKLISNLLNVVNVVNQVDPDADTDILSAISDAQTSAVNAIAASGDKAQVLMDSLFSVAPSFESLTADISDGRSYEDMKFMLRTDIQDSLSLNSRALCLGLSKLTKDIDDYGLGTYNTGEGSAWVTPDATKFALVGEYKDTNHYTNAGATAINAAVFNSVSNRGASGSCYVSAVSGALRPLNSYNVQNFRSDVCGLYRLQVRVFRNITVKDLYAVVEVFPVTSNLDFVSNNNAGSILSTVTDIRVEQRDSANNVLLSTYGRVTYSNTAWTDIDFTVNVSSAAVSKHIWIIIPLSTSAIGATSTTAAYKYTATFTPCVDDNRYVLRSYIANSSIEDAGMIDPNGVARAFFRYMNLYYLYRQTRAVTEDMNLLKWVVPDLVAAGIGAVSGTVYNGVALPHVINEGVFNFEWWLTVTEGNAGLVQSAYSRFVKTLIRSARFAAVDPNFHRYLRSNA